MIAKLSSLIYSRDFKVIHLGKGFLTKWLLLIFALHLWGCDERGDTRMAPFSLAPDVPNQFLRFINQQPSLAAGNYQLSILPTTSEVGTYSGTLTLAGAEADISGQWQVGVDINWQSTLEPSHDVTLPSAGGFDLQLSCDKPCMAYVVKANFLFLQHSFSATNETWSVPVSQINSPEYAKAYYSAVDESESRTTLANWKSHNGFDEGFDHHVIFRDSKDLGYGRDMYARINDNGSLAFFVNNFVLALGKGNPANYGPLNLLAAVDQNMDYLLGSNAIELSPIDENDDQSDLILKFFTFSAPDENGEQVRIESADLDGRGIKHMPGMCQVCHGATLLPLNADGSFNLLTLKSAKLNQLEVDSFEFMETGVYSKTNQQPAIKTLNQAIHDSFATLATRDSFEPGFWDSSFAQLVAQGRYGGDGFISDEFVEADIPTGWQQTSNRPEGVEILYKQVVEPHCISCHSLRGFNAGNDQDLDEVLVNGLVTQTGNSINFSSYEKFIGYSDLIIDYVYRRGAMPLSLRNYEQFWGKDSEAPNLLAGFLPGFDVVNELGLVQQAGNAVARAGQDRSARSPVLLVGSGSYFANTFSWQVLSAPVNSVYSIENSQSSLATLNADTDGEYLVQLTVDNSRAQPHTSTFTLTLDSTLNKHGSHLNFADDIAPLLQTTLYNQRTCQSCHYSESDIEGIPVYYDSGNLNVYWDVRARVDFNDPDNSILIRKPTRLQHGGGVRLDLASELGRSVYSVFMDWIAHGAPCGQDENICVMQ